MNREVGCDGLHHSFGIFTPCRYPSGEPYIMSGYGQSYPQPPSGYELASVKDIMSSDFLKFYNTNGLAWANQAPMAGCCVFQLIEGYLTTTAGGWIGPYTPQGKFECTEIPRGRIWFGYDIGAGPDQGQYIGPINATFQSTFTTQGTINPGLCGPVQNTFALFKAPKCP